MFFYELSIICEGMIDILYIHILYIVSLMLIIQWRKNIIKMMPWTSAFYLFNAWSQMGPKLYEFSTKIAHYALKWPRPVWHCYSAFEEAIHLHCCFPTNPCKYVWTYGIPLLSVNSLSSQPAFLISSCLLCITLEIFFFSFSFPLYLFSLIFVCMDPMTSSYAN